MSTHVRRERVVARKVWISALTLCVGLGCIASTSIAQTPPWAKADVGPSRAQWFSFGGEQSTLAQDPPSASLTTSDGNASATAQAYIDIFRVPKLGVKGANGRGATATAADNFYANLTPEITAAPDGVIFNMRLSGTMRAPVNGTGPFGWFEDSSGSLMAPLIVLRVVGQHQTDFRIGEVALAGGPERTLDATSSASLGMQNIFTDTELGVAPLPGVVVVGNDATARFSNFKVPFLFENFPVNMALGDHKLTFSIGIGTGTTSTVGPVPDGTLGDFAGTLTFDPVSPISLLLGEEIVDLPPGSSYQLGENAPLQDVVPEPASWALVMLAVICFGWSRPSRVR